MGRKESAGKEGDVSGGAADRLEASTTADIPTASAALAPGCEVRWTTSLHYFFVRRIYTSLLPTALGIK